MTTCSALDLGYVEVSEFIDMRPAPHKSATQAIAEAAGRAQDAKVYSLIARRAADLDIEAQFAELADDATEWAELTFGAASEVWPTD